MTGKERSLRSDEEWGSPIIKGRGGGKWRLQCAGAGRSDHLPGWSAKPSESLPRSARRLRLMAATAVKFPARS